MVNEQENIAEYWKEQIDKAENPSNLLMKMYQSVTEDTTNYYAIFGKLVKLYGRDNVYFSILDCASMEVKGNPYRILNYFCQKRLTEKPKPDIAIPIAEIKEKQKRLRENGRK